MDDKDNTSEFDTIVLSGGSVNGISILGALQYLKDNNMINNIKTYIGTSVGSIIVYLLVIGYSPIEIIVYLCTHNYLFEKLKCFDIVTASRGEGATSFIHISEQLEKMTIEKTGRLLTMKDIETIYNKKFICVTYNMTKCCVEYISDENYPDIPCLTALRMSCNLPLIFESYKYGDSFYIDGGLANNFPIDIAENYGEKILGICLDFDIKEDNQAANLLEYVYKLLVIPISQSATYRIQNKKDFVEVVELKSAEGIKFFNFDLTSKTKLEMFSHGYEDIKNHFET